MVVEKAICLRKDSCLSQIVCLSYMDSGLIPHSGKSDIIWGIVIVVGNAELPRGYYRHNFHPFKFRMQSYDFFPSLPSFLSIKEPTFAIFVD